MERKKTEFTILPAFHGDCIIVKTYDLANNEFIILIDGGTSSTFKYSLKTALANISHINLLVLTHIDSDHIGGLINFFKSSLINKIVIDEIWVNHPDIIEVNDGETISTGQGDKLINLINIKLPKTNVLSISNDIDQIDKEGNNFIILSPTQEISSELYHVWKMKRKNMIDEKVNISFDIKVYDRTLEELSKQPFKPDTRVLEDIYNASSIAFLLLCRDVSILFLADSRPEVIYHRLIELGYSIEKPLVVDYVKVSHHGSLNNTSQELLSLIKCNNYIISTNGGTADHKLPSRETIAKLVYNSNRSEDELKIYFNYSVESLIKRNGNFINDKDQENGNWSPVLKNSF